MSVLRRGGLCWVVAAATMLAPATPAGAASTTATRPEYRAAAASTAISWKSCDDGFQCATVQVPLDYDRPAGATVSLALIRLLATDRKHRQGSLFINPGGPGGSGVGAVRGEGKSYPASIRRQFDLVGFDPRGIGASTPLRCFSSQQQADAAAHPSPFPLTAPDIRQWKRVDQLLAADCAANAGLIIDHMSTANVARDLDRLRGLVGDATLNFIGFSYGSILGQTYANMFPSKVGALVIDGVLDPVAWSTGRGRQSQTVPFTVRIGSAQAGELALSQFFTLCDKARQDCAFAGHSRARFDALAATLRTAPVEFPGAPGFFIGFAGLMRLASNAMYRPSSWPGLAEDLADLEAAAGVSRSTSSPGTPERLQSADATDEYAQFEDYDGVICSDTDNPDNFGQWIKASQRTSAKEPHFGALWTWSSSACAFWPGQDADRYTGPYNRKTANPVLVVGNYYDPATPYAGAQAAARLLPNSRLLSYAGWGHQPSILNGNACITTAMVKYLVTSTLPPRGMVCRPTFSPFDATSTRLAPAVASTDTMPPLLGPAGAGA